MQAAVGSKCNTSHHFTAVVWLMEEEIFSNFPGNFIPITIIIIKCWWIYSRKFSRSSWCTCTTCFFRHYLTRHCWWFYWPINTKTKTPPPEYTSPPPRNLYFELCAKPISPSRITTSSRPNHKYIHIHFMGRIQISLDLTRCAWHFDILADGIKRDTSQRFFVVGTLWFAHMCECVCVTWKSHSHYFV